MGDARRRAALRRHGLRRRERRLASFPRRARAHHLRRSRRGSGAARHRESTALVTEVARPWGRYLEDFEEGMVIKHWPGKTITEYDDHLFCLITMNHHPLHLDAFYAAERTQFGQNVVVGNLVYSVALGMSVADISGKAIANLEIESLKHENPTFHGDTVYAETTVLEVRESASKPDRGVIQVETRAYNQRGERVCVFIRRVLVPKRTPENLEKFEPRIPKPDSE